jgi:hypothetical protein
MRVLDTAEQIDIDTASPERMRDVARRYRAEAAAVAERYAWAARYASPPPPPPERSLADLMQHDLDAPPFDREAFDANLRRARAMLEIEDALAAETAAAEQTKADAAAQTASAFRQTAISTLMRR